MKTTMIKHQKIVFQLDRDEDGYPPSDYERLWAIPLPNGNYLIDNIPFYVIGISVEDEVLTEVKDGELYFKELIKPSGISTFRLIPSDPSMSGKVRSDVKELGGMSEYSQELGLIAVEIPASISIQPFLDYIMEEQENGVLDFEEGALRHEVDSN